MARPERNDVDYFPHEVGSGKKMYYIETKYGNDGYATRYKLLEELWRAEYHYLDLSKFENVMFLSAKCKVDETTLLNIIWDLAKMWVFDQKLIEINIVRCQKFVDSIQDAYARRKNTCITRDGLLEHLRSKWMHKPSKCTTETQQDTENDDNNTQSKVDYTKVENIIVEDKVVDETSSSIVPTGDPDKNLPDISPPDQEEIDRKKKVAKRNQKLVDGVKAILQEHGMAYKKHPTMEKRQANQFFRSKDYLAVVAQYQTTPGEFALQLCRWAMEHDFWRGKVTNTAKLYDHRASIHNECVAKFKKKTDRRKGL